MGCPFLLMKGKNIVTGEQNKKARQFALAVAKLAGERHCTDIAVMDLTGISPATDYFVIATGTSDRQLRSVCDEIATHGKGKGHPVWQVAGRDSGDWVVMDFVDVVVHLFEQSRRSYYDLELIWGEAPRVDWQR